MRLNKYTLVIQNNAQTILYNCITKMLLVVDVPYNQITSDFISSLDADSKKLLQERLIISTDTNDDFAEFIKIKNSFNNSTEIGHFLIHIGYRCNMRCSYYYQNKLHNDKSSINVTQVIDFITTVVKENNYKNLDICFIGGEPLLYYKQLLKIATEINKNPSSSFSKQLSGRNLLQVNELALFNSPYLLMISKINPAVMKSDDFSKWQYVRLLNMGTKEKDRKVRYYRQKMRKERLVQLVSVKLF